MKNWATIIKQSEIILSRLFTEDSVFLLFHDDADGCCAAALLLNLIWKKNPDGFLGFTSPEKHSVELTPRILRKLRQKRPKFIISLDLALLGSVEKIGNILDALDSFMLIYDHHLHPKSLRWPDRCVYINPLKFNLGNFPASYYSYILLRHYTESSDACWAAAVGVVADYRAEECRDLLDEVRQRYPSLYPFKTTDQQTALRSPLMTLAHLVNAGYQHSDYEGARVAMEALNEALQANDPAMLLEGETEKAKLLHRFREEINKELTKLLEQFSSKAEFHLDSRLAFYTIKPKFNVTSQLATQLQHSHPNTVIAVVSPETRKTLKVSLRRGSQARINLAAFAEITTNGLAYATGGGHLDAAGCVIREKDIALWKKNVIQHLHKTLR